MERETKETRIRVQWRPGTGRANVVLEGALEGSEPQGEHDSIPGRIAFTRHMLTTLSHWSGHDLDLDAQSKDGLLHHLLEDACIALGQAIRASVDTGRIERTAHVVLPMDDALVLVAVDLVERPYYEGPLPDATMDHLLRSLAQEAKMTLHVQVLRGRDAHHVVEATFKGLGLCLRQALRPRGERLGTKGGVEARP
ncbi:MAG: imidazoleglycerol-phosphate dehydratase [Thermoplasmatota archaeon]